jgi:hypothetical protein
MAKPDEWGVTAGDKLLKQHAETTTKQEMEDVTKFHKSQVKG